MFRLASFLARRTGAKRDLFLLPFAYSLSLRFQGFIKKKWVWSMRKLVYS